VHARQATRQRSEARRLLQDWLLERVAREAAAAS
jgi:hypothetical protein